MTGVGFEEQGRSRREGVAVMSEVGRRGGGQRRGEVLDVLRASPAPMGVTEVATAIGVHPNTVRFHLDALVADGVVERTVAEPAGPGRPRTVYSARPGMDRGGTRSYRLLARMLLSRLAASVDDRAHAHADQTAGITEITDMTEIAGIAGPAGTVEAVETGRVWGGYLVDEPPPYQRVTAQEAVAHLTALLAELGFDPEPQPNQRAGAGAGLKPLADTHQDTRAARPGRRSGRGRPEPVPDRIRLRHCPFLELAEEYGQIVCPLHLGLMQGALAELRAPVSATRIEPFAEPGACLAHLAPAGGP